MLSNKQSQMFATRAHVIILTTSSTDLCDEMMYVSPTHMIMKIYSLFSRLMMPRRRAHTNMQPTDTMSPTVSMLRV